MKLLESMAKKLKNDFVEANKCAVSLNYSCSIDFLLQIDLFEVFGRLWIPFQLKWGVLFIDSEYVICRTI